MEVQQVTRNIRVNQDSRNISVRRATRTISVSAGGRRGPQGIQGPEGPQGEQGEIGNDKNFTQNFTNSSEVTVNHNLGKLPAVTVQDSTGDEVVGDIEHVSINQLIARFSASFTGIIACN